MEAAHHRINFAWLLREEGDPESARVLFEQTLRECRRTGDASGVAECFLGLACVASDLGRWRDAAALHGLADALLERIGLPTDPNDRPRADSIERVAEVLGTDEFERVYAEGKKRDVDEALDAALGRVVVVT